MRSIVKIIMGILSMLIIETIAVIVGKTIAMAGMVATAVIETGEGASAWSMTNGPGADDWITAAITSVHPGEGTNGGRWTDLTFWPR